MFDTQIKRLYLMEVGSVPEHQIPVVCYLVQTEEGKNILIDTGLTDPMPVDETDFANGVDVIQQLSQIGLTPDDIDTAISTHYDIDHAGRHGAFTNAKFVVQRSHHEDALSGNPRLAALKDQWDLPMGRITLVEGDTLLLPGLELIETSGHVTGHQSVLVHLPKTGPVLLTVEAVSFADSFTREIEPDPRNPDPEQARISIFKLMDLVEQKHIPLVVFGHERSQWDSLKQLPEHYT